MSQYITHRFAIYQSKVLELSVPKMQLQTAKL